MVAQTQKQNNMENLRIKSEPIGKPGRYDKRLWTVPKSLKGDKSFGDNFCPGSALVLIAAATVFCRLVSAGVCCELTDVLGEPADDAALVSNSINLRSN